MLATKRFKTTLTKKIDFPYLLHLPKNYNTSSSYPLIVFLHGAGERVCGRDKANSANKLKGISTWAFHGAKDDIVPVGESKKVVKAMNALGGDARLTVYPDADHNAWDRAYKTKELYDWLFTQRKH
ncbi:MAG: prolyl oligopeptidase family serine peptidase [Trueperaceae bacterium]